MLPDWKIRREIIEIGRRIYERGLAPGTDGNISFKLADDRILITASGTCLGELKTTDIILIDNSGKIISGNGKPSTETPMHLEVYRHRPAINAVIHAHPPTATAFSIAGISLAGCVIPEIAMTLGKIPTAPYAAPSSDEGARAISGLITNHDAILLDRHGAITIGETIKSAFYKMEKVEYAAKVTLAARQLQQTTSEESVCRVNDSSCSECGSCDHKDVG